MNNLYFFNIFLYKNKFSFNVFKLNIFLFFIFLYFVIFFLFCFLLIFFLYKKKFNKKTFYFKNFFIEIFFFFYLLIFILLISIYSTKFFLKIKKYFLPYSIIKIVGYQWKWYYLYLWGSGAGISYFSNISTNIWNIFNLSLKNKKYILEVDKKLIIPLNKNCKLLFTSNDVIHSWFIPNFITKQDAIPGYIKDFFIKCNKVGSYRGFCTELCGKNHSYMPFVIKVVKIFDYKKWIISNYFEKLINIKF